MGNPMKKLLVALALAGIVFFVHKGVKHLAVAQNGKRVLVLTLDGKIVSEELRIQNSLGAVPS